MLEDLDSANEISELTNELLRRADALGRWPTPVDDIVTASRLEEPDQSPFDLRVLARAPAYLRKAVALVEARRIRGILDRRERTVHIDPSIEHEGQRSFLRLHEVAHDLFPWQTELAYADDDLTLSAKARRQFEREANQGAAELLFQGDGFRSMAAEYRVGMAAVSELAELTGASLRATLRRYAESHRRAVCGIVLDPSPISRDPMTFRRREVSQSPKWTKQFGHTWPARLSVDAFPFLEGTAGVPVPLTWPNLDLEPTSISVDVVRNRYAVLVLLWVPAREVLKRKRVLAKAGTS